MNSTSDKGAAVDTNILAYAEGVNGFEPRQAALGILRRLPTRATVIPVQALGELYNVRVRKTGRSAAELAAAHRLGIWDSLILAVSAENGCGFLLSEEL